MLTRVPLTKGLLESLIGMKLTLVVQKPAGKVIDGTAREVKPSQEKLLVAHQEPSCDLKE